jgi:hypothetical protein
LNKPLLAFLKVAFGGLAFWQAAASFTLLWAQCTPTAATLYASADDQLVVFINGNAVSFGGQPVTVNYVTAPGTLPTYSITPSDFVSGNNVIAVEDHNITPTEVLASWVIDVTCSSGQHAYFSNTDPGYMMCVDSTGSTPPAVDGSGNPWYSVNYSAAVSALYFTGTPFNNVSESNDPYLQPMYNPETGLIQPYTSDNATGYTTLTNAPNLYYRGSFPLNAVPYTPPTFSLSKIPGFASYPPSTSTSSEPYTLVVCNNGVPVNTPVTVWDSSPSGGSYSGASYSYNPPGQVYSTGGSNPFYFAFPLGFVGNGACVTLLAPIAGLNTVYGSPVTNTAAVTWNGGQVAAGGVVVGVNTNTPTYTATLTLTPTFTPTLTTTSTPCGFPGNTCTPTTTPTPSPTLVSADIFYVDHNSFRPSQGPVSIEVEYTQYPGNYSLRVYNSAGELIKILDSRYLNSPVYQWYSWDGTNKFGNKCASGVYIFYLIEPFDRKLKRVILIH